MLMVENDADAVDRGLCEGRVACPTCDGALRPWGWARRRLLRRRDGPVWLRPRRARCRSCGGTHVLLPVDSLVRRRDEVAVIGAALLAWLGGVGHRRIAASLRLPVDTVRGWLRRFSVRVEDVRVHFWRLAYRLDASLGVIEPRGSRVADALEAIGVAAAAAVRRFGPASSLWAFVSGATGGRLLCNTNCPYLRLDEAVTITGT